MEIMKIKLRNDGWFEAGKELDKTVPIANVIYAHKQQLKCCLQSINATNKGDLEQALSKFPDIQFFEGKPFLVGDKVYIFKSEGMGEAYLGNVA